MHALRISDIFGGLYASMHALHISDTFAGPCASAASPVRHWCPESGCWLPVSVHEGGPFHELIRAQAHAQPVVPYDFEHRKHTIWNFFNAGLLRQG